MGEESKEVYRKGWGMKKQKKETTGEKVRKGTKKRERDKEGWGKGKGGG